MRTLLDIETMYSVCQILSCTSASTLTTFGETVNTYTAGSNVNCGFWQHGGKKVIKGQVVQVDSDATLRLPLGTTIKKTDRVYVTNAWGTSASLVFDVDSVPYNGAFFTVVELKKVST